ncbi:MAG: hypothetical protein ACE5G9_10025 [Nitrospinales bacterium]
MTERLESSGESASTPGPGADSNLISRDEFHKVVSQRDRIKEELRAIRGLLEEADQTNRQLHSQLEEEMQNKNLTEKQSRELEIKLQQFENKHLVEKEQLEEKFRAAQEKLKETEGELSGFQREKMLAQQERAFMQAARRASYSHENAETLLGYLRGQGRLRSVPISGDGAPEGACQHEVECEVPRKDGSGYEKQMLPFDEALPYLKQEKKNLAPAMASGGGRGSRGSDGPVRPGVLNRKTLTLEQYKAGRNPVTGQVLVQ